MWKPDKLTQNEKIYAAWHDNFELKHSFETNVMLKYHIYYSKARPNLF